MKEGALMELELVISVLREDLLPGEISAIERCGGVVLFSEAGE